MKDDQVNVLLVDDQPGKLLTYEAILRDLGENLITAKNASEALEILLKNEISVVLIDVYMPETDGFELAAMIREHPRFEKTAIIFISAILLTDVDRLRGYEMGAVDYVPVPVIPEVLRAKVRVFTDLYRKTRDLEKLNRELEARVEERTAALVESTSRLRYSQQLHSLALAAGKMGSWRWNVDQDRISCDQGQCDIFGVDTATFTPSRSDIRRLVHPDDVSTLVDALRQLSPSADTFQIEFRIRRPSGEIRWCAGAVAASFGEKGSLEWLSGITVDLTERKMAEERQMMLAGEVDHRARNVVAVIQSIVRSTQARSIEDYVSVLEGRIQALSNAHKLLANSRWEGADLMRLAAEEFAPYLDASRDRVSISGPEVVLLPAMAQTIALAFHELATNAAKYGSLSVETGRVDLTWRIDSGELAIEWSESGGPGIEPPARQGYGTRIIRAGVERQLQGQVDFEWRPGGLHCALVVPFDDGSAATGRNSKKYQRTETRPDIPDAEPDVKADAPSVNDAPADSGYAILLVEDEPLVSMMLADMISDLGHTVDGPYNRVADALRSAESNLLQAGVLDINVGGENIYGLAGVLTRRNIPFVFVTGYSSASIDPRFTHVPIVQKPIEQNSLREALLATKRGG
jgi:PAS domain S-box-containing protein